MLPEKLNTIQKQIEESGRWNNISDFIESLNLYVMDLSEKKKPKTIKDALVMFLASIEFYRTDKDVITDLVKNNKIGKIEGSIRQTKENEFLVRISQNGSPSEKVWFRKDGLENFSYGVGNIQIASLSI